MLSAIVRRFGPGVLRPDGTLDRGQLRAMVLASPEALKDLNAIVHPAVNKLRNARVAEAREAGAQVVVTDIPLLFEVADPDSFDVVILVDAPDDLRRQRLFERSGLPRHESDRLMAAQLPAADQATPRRLRHRQRPRRRRPRGPDGRNLVCTGGARGSLTHPAASGILAPDRLPLEHSCRTFPPTCVTPPITST